MQDIAGVSRALLPSKRLQRIRQELLCYDDLFRQRLGARWQESYGKEGLRRLERLYGGDLEAYGYGLPNRRMSTVRPLAALDSDALGNPLQQLRDRQQQIAGLQEQLLETQRQLAAAQQAVQRPPLPSTASSPSEWPPHNAPEAELEVLYEAIADERPQQVLELAASHQGGRHLGVLAYLVGLAHGQLNCHDQALIAYGEAQAAGFHTPMCCSNDAYRALDQYRCDPRVPGST